MFQFEMFIFMQTNLRLFDDNTKICTKKPLENKALFYLIQQAYKLQMDKIVKRVLRKIMFHACM